MLELLSSIPELIASIGAHPYAIVALGILSTIGVFLAKHFLSRIGDDIYGWIKSRIFRRKSKEPLPVQTSAQETDSSGEFKPFDVETSLGKYHASELIGRGEMSALYAAETNNGKKVLIKIALQAGDNDLLQNEARMLKLLLEGGTTYNKHLPEYFDQFRTARGNVGLVLGKVEGFDLRAVRERYPDGIPQEHIIWIFRRTLAVAGHAHSLGIIHGNIEPSHILVSPPDHNVFLIDWGYSVYRPNETSQGFRVINEQFSPPEVAERKSPIPSSDLYSIGKCMIYLLGGNVQTDAMPGHVDERIQRFIKFFTRPSALQRAQDAWQMYAKLDDLREEVFGPHKFREFKM
ncbi:MAG: hypothetical protein JNM27_18910 [Leptospirales bacterium]|nr:hypothetical protein [Leptospirales bacterium]